MKLQPLERQWIYYDVGNSAFTLLATTVLPIYFNAVAEQGGLSSTDYLAYWGYASSIVTLLVAIIAPLFGSMADSDGAKKRIFTGFLIIGLLGTALLGINVGWLGFLVIYIIAKTGYQASLVFYDAMLTDVTTPERMDEVSSRGYAWGYIGSVIPFALGLVLVLKGESLGLSFQTRMGGNLLLTALWWLLFSIPLLRHYKQTHFLSREATSFSVVRKRLRETAREIRQNPKVLHFLVAFFFYIDGVYTIISMAVAYGTSLGLDSTSLLLALLVTQIVAFPFALLFGWLSRRVGTARLIRIAIIAYAGITAFAMQLDRAWEFWFLAICVGMFQGGAQALSRSYFARIIPAERSGEYFGIYDICGKGASFLGTFLVAWVTQLTGRQELGVGILLLFFVIGLFYFQKSVRAKEIV